LEGSIVTDLRYWKSLPKFKDLPTTYERLVTYYAPRPIGSAAELARATAIVDVLAGHKLNHDQEDYLDLVSTIVSDYEQRHHPVRSGRLTPVEALKVLAEEAGMSASDLGRLLGNRELGSKILRGERGLSLNHIAILAERFAMEPQVFMTAGTRARARPSPEVRPSWRGREPGRARLQRKEV
jgi:HTH-type transcriptional regulator / antitoxin HigA